jgi:hypothetical protein
MPRSLAKPLPFLLMALCLPAGLRAQQSEAPTRFAVLLTSGVFGLPAEARSVDWAVLNNSPDSQRVRVTVYRVSSAGPKTTVWPGVLTFVVQPGRLFHSGNTVGPTAPYAPGMTYEVVVELNDRRVLPTVTVWSDAANTVIAGTRLGPRDFVELRP